MLRIGIILGSTRPNRNGEQVAKWVYDIASRRGDAEYELVDLRDYPLPHLDEPLSPSFGQYQHEPCARRSRASEQPRRPDHRTRSAAVTGRRTRKVAPGPGLPAGHRDRAAMGQNERNCRCCGGSGIGPGYTGGSSRSPGAARRGVGRP